MKYFFIIITLSIINFDQLKAQNSDTLAYTTTHNLGLGLGLTYGGIGGRYILNTSEVVGLTIGLGYNLAGLGYNTGAIFNIPSKTFTNAYFSAMYGTNASIIIEGVPDLTKSYGGVSFGAGVKFQSWRNPGNYWDLGFIVPVRSSQFKDDYEQIKNNRSISINAEPWPVLINIGYNFVL